MISRTTRYVGCGLETLIPGQSHLGMTFTEPFPKMSAEGILCRHRMAKSLEVWIKKKKRKKEGRKGRKKKKKEKIYGFLLLTLTF